MKEITLQWEVLLSEVNSRETIAAIEANNTTYCLQEWIEKFPLIFSSHIVRYNSIILYHF